MKILFYTLISLFLLNCKKTENIDHNWFISGVKNYPTFKNKCKILKLEYEELLARMEVYEGQMLFKDRKSMLKGLKLIEDSPKLYKEYNSLNKEFSKIKNPTKEEVEALMKLNSSNCWTTVHARIWKSVFGSYIKFGKNADSKKIKSTLKKRLIESGPRAKTLLGVFIDSSIIKSALKAGVIKPIAAEVDKFNEFLNKSKVARKSINEYIKKHSPEGADLMSIDKNRLLKILYFEDKNVLELREELYIWMNKNIWS